MGRYQEALEVSDQQIKEANTYRLAFVLPHSHVRRAIALRGLRRFRDALDCLTEAQRDRAAHGDFLAIAVESVRIGIYLARGEFDAALQVKERGLPTSGAPNALAELSATRALALACVERFDDAQGAVQQALSVSTAAEPRTLAKLATATISLLAGLPTASELAHDAFDDVVASGNVDAFVTSYRGCPALLTEVARKDEYRPRLRTILTGARDIKLASAVLPGSLLGGSEGTSLSARENDVMVLVAQGLRNREIAEKLFISEVTVKAHVRNILRKLGAPSRAHAVSLFPGPD